MRIPNKSPIGITPGMTVDVYMLDGWRVGVVAAVEDGEILVNVVTSSGGRFPAWVTPGQIREHVDKSTGGIS